jgi:hypothetical protein
MQLDQLLEAAEKDRKELEKKKNAILDEIEKFRASKLDEIAEVEGQLKRINKVLRAAGAEVTGAAAARRRAPRVQPGDPNYKYRQVGAERLQAFATAASKLKGQFTRGELSEATGKLEGVKIGEGQATYAVRDLVALGWIEQIPDPSRANRFFLFWSGPAKPEVAPLIEDRVIKFKSPQGAELERVAGWQFKDAETRKRAGME